MAKRESTGLERFYTGRAVPPLIGTLGSCAISVIKYWGNVDFILSLRNRDLANVFQLLLDYGVWLLLVACVMWYSWAVQNQDQAAHIWPAVIMTALVSFGIGTVVTADAVGYRTFKLKQVGIGPRHCEAIVPMAELRRFSDSYDFVLACGPIDASIDRYKDTKVALSAPFTISGSDTKVSATATTPGLDFRNVSQLWFYPVLLPKGVRREQYQTLGDLIAVGGLVIADDEELTVFPN